MRNLNFILIILNITQVTKEYEEGILLFNITNDKVWNKAVIDTASLEKFYMNNTDDHVHPESVMQLFLNV